MPTFQSETTRDVLLVTGDDALTYLQSQISQDIRGLGDGESAYTLVLQPNGKVDALARVLRRGATEFRLDTDPGFGNGLLARLNRFKIRVKADIEAIPMAVVAVRGVSAPPAGGVPAWGLPDAWDVFGDGLGEAATPTSATLAIGTADDLLLARIEAGWPAMGAEITDATIPAESGIVAHAVSFTKGCYPGQELVERMDSRGSTAPRFVRRLRGSGSAAVGDEVTNGGKPAGHLTSVASTSDGWVALAIVARSVAPGDMVSVAGVDATVEDTDR